MLDYRHCISTELKACNNRPNGSGISLSFKGMIKSIKKERKLWQNKDNRRMNGKRLQQVCPLNRVLKLHQGGDVKGITIPPNIEDIVI